MKWTFEHDNGRNPQTETARFYVETLAIVDGNTVAVRYKNQLALSFHPEVSEDARVHAYFLNEIVQGV